MFYDFSLQFVPQLFGVSYAFQPGDCLLSRRSRKRRCCVVFSWRWKFVMEVAMSHAPAHSYWSSTFIIT